MPALVAGSPSFVTPNGGTFNASIQYTRISRQSEAIVLSAPAGVYADRHDKRALMIGTNLLRGGLILLIPLFQAIPYLRHQAWPLLLTTLLFSCVGQVFAPAEAASIPFLVRRPQIMAATSLMMTTLIVTLVVGVPLATISLRLFSDVGPFYIASGLFGIAALCVWRMGTSLRAAARAHAPHSDIVRELREGAVILGRDPGLRIDLGLLTLALVVIFTVVILGAFIGGVDYGLSEILRRYLYPH